MKNYRVSKIALALLIGGISLVSCKESPKLPQSTEDNIEATPQVENTELKVDIADYFPGANFMKILAGNENTLQLSDAQENIFEAWRKENHSKIEMKMKQAASLEKEIKTLSQEKADATEILAKTEETELLRQEIATTKLQCRDYIIENLSPEQWDALVAKYQSDFPFVGRTKMMDVMQHVNPVPNYMQVVNANTDELKITPEQKSTFDTWSNEHHPLMVEMADKIISLEKEIYEASLLNASEDIILEKITEMAKLRNDIVTKKTQCRDMVIKTLKTDQWESLVEKT